MPKTFGYLNQGNPLTIGDNEAQEMVNCAIERGWLEYKAYPVPTGLYDCVPNREVKLPNGTVLRLWNEDNKYGDTGIIKTYNKTDNSYGQFGVKLGWVQSGNILSGDYIQPTKAANTSQKTYGYYCVCTSTVTTESDKTTYNLPSPVDDINGAGYTYNSDFIEYSTIKGVAVNSSQIAGSMYTILDSGSGYPVIVLSNPLAANQTITVKWYYAFHNTVQGQGELIVKESQDVFYAVTVEETNNNSLNKGYESVPFSTRIPVVISSEPSYYTNDQTGMAIPRLTVEIPNDTGALTPQVNVYRMPFGGSEYLLDFSTTANIANRLDSVSDSNLGDMLETEGNTEQYLYQAYPVSMMIHNDRLFLAENKLLVYSKPSQFNEFPAENFYAFSDEVIDICKYDSNLAVFTKTKSYIIYGAGTDGFVIAEVDWKTLWHIRNCAQSVYTKLISLVSDENVTLQDNEDYPHMNRRIVCYNHRYAQDISLRVKDLLNKGAATLKVNEDLCNRNTVLENRYYVAELRYYTSTSATANQVKKFNLVYDVIADGFCIYDQTVKDFNNQTVFRYRTKEYKMVTPPTHQAQYHKGIYVKGKGTFKVNVYADGELLTSLTHTETDNSKPMRIILHNMGNKRGSTISLEFIGTQGAQIHDWEVYD